MVLSNQFFLAVLQLHSKNKKQTKQNKTKTWKKKHQHKKIKNPRKECRSVDTWRRLRTCWGQALRTENLSESSHKGLIPVTQTSRTQLHVLILPVWRIKVLTLEHRRVYPNQFLWVLIGPLRCFCGVYINLILLPDSHHTTQNGYYKPFRRNSISWTNSSARTY